MKKMLPKIELLAINGIKSIKLHWETRTSATILWILWKSEAQSWKKYLYTKRYIFVNVSA